MSIRDELIRWLAENAAWDTADAEDLVDALDSLPPAMLAQLAIDTGALIKSGRRALVRSESTPDGRVRNYFANVYRVAGEES